MMLLSRARDIVSHARELLSAPRGKTCFDCAHFRNDAASVEAALPGVSSLSSVHASVRADDGLCELNQRYINGRRACDAHRTSL